MNTEKFAKRKMNKMIDTKKNKILGFLGFGAFVVFIELMFFRNIIGNDNLIGNNGDARYIDLILEHYYGFLNGRENFTDLICFYPVKNTISYSDMLLALAIPFCIFRFMGMSMFMANKLGLILIHTIGTISTVSFLNKKLKFNPFATAIGTIVFCYANSLSVKSWHNQMFAVCLVPVILILLWNFFENINKSTKIRVFSGFGAITMLALIFYTSFYNAYYFLIYAIFLITVYMITLSVKKVPIFKPIGAFFKFHIIEVIFYVLYGIGIMIPFLIIYLPTLQSSGGWDWEPVQSMLPTWRDFFNVSPFNIVYGAFMEGNFFKLEGFYAGELRTGFPLITFFLFVVASIWLYFKYGKKKYSKKNTSFEKSSYIELLFFAGAIAVFCCFLIMLKVHGYSIWYIIYKYLPGASGLRAVSRFNMFLTLPVAIISAFFADKMIPLLKLPKIKKIVMLVGICGWLILENTLSVGVRSLWTISEASKITQTASAPPADCQVMYIIDSGDKKQFNNDKDYQLAAWEIANKYNIVTINGHSGQFPSDWSYKMSPYHSEEEYYKSIDEWISNYQISDVYAYDINTNTWIKY